MFLLPIPDEVKTAENVRKFLKHDYPKLCAVAGKPVSYLKATNYDGMPKKPNAINHADDAIIKRIDAKASVEWVRKAFERLGKLSAENSNLLYEASILDKDRQSMADLRTMHRSSLQTKLQIARCQFAGCLDDVSGGRLSLIEWKK